MKLAFLLLFVSSPVIQSRPTILNEQTLSYHQSFLSGVYVGFESFLALTGFYEEDAVSKSVQEETLIIDAEEEENQTTIQIVGIGLGRTGTTSLVVALEILGYTVVHDDEQTELTDLFAAEERGDIDMDTFHDILGLRGFNATLKTAGHNWVAKHPEVKAILTVRDTPDKYVDSWLVAAPFIDMLYKRPFCWFSTVDELLPSLESEFREETTGGNPLDFLDRETLKDNYIEYINEVQHSIPSDRLLVFNVKQGWEPLCQYLNKSIPEGIPFPHVHTRAKLEGEMWFLRIITYIWPLFISLPMALILFLLRRFTMRNSKRKHGYYWGLLQVNIVSFIVAVSAVAYFCLPATDLTLDDDDDDDW